MFCNAFLMHMPTPCVALSHSLLLVKRIAFGLGLRFRSELQYQNNTPLSKTMDDEKCFAGLVERS